MMSAGGFYPCSLQDNGYTPQLWRYDGADAANNKQQLAFHAEKKALACGLQMFPASDTIYCSKNVRTCGDCHDFFGRSSTLMGLKLLLFDENSVYVQVFDLPPQEKKLVIDTKGVVWLGRTLAERYFVEN